jgi:hypothetical protein
MGILLIMLATQKNRSMEKFTLLGLFMRSTSEMDYLNHFAV